MVDTIMGKELMPATESLSIYRAQKVMLVVLKTIMKWGPAVPIFMESPKFYDRYEHAQ